MDWSWLVLITCFRNSGCIRRLELLKLRPFAPSRFLFRTMTFLHPTSLLRPECAGKRLVQRIYTKQIQIGHAGHWQKKSQGSSSPLGFSFIPSQSFFCPDHPSSSSFWSARESTGEHCVENIEKSNGRVSRGQWIIRRNNPSSKGNVEFQPASRCKVRWVVSPWNECGSYTARATHQEYTKKVTGSQL